MSTIGKLVVLKLDGNLEQGFQVMLEIGVEGDRPSTEMPGKLPADPALVEQLTQWRQTYSSLGPSRIKPKEIVYGGSVNQLKECQQLGEELSDRFNQWLQSPLFQPLDRRLREELSLDDSIRVLIRTQNNDLRHLPWHLWEFIEHYSRAEVAFGAFERREITPILSASNQVKILAVLGNSTGINIAEDRRILESLPDADMTFLVEPKHHEINDQLWDQPWDVLFFAGHSETPVDRGVIHINPQESLTLDQLKYGLRQAIGQGLRLAVFNSCDGLGLAYELEKLHLPQLIVMRERVPDRVAQKFLKHFLTAFASGDSFYLAERKARQRLHGLESEFPCASWLPVIYQNSIALPPTWETLRNKLPQPPSRSLIFKKPKLRIILAASLMITALVMWGRWQGNLQPMELIAYDQLMRLRPSVEQRDDRLLVVRITSEDIARLNEPLSETGQGARSLSDHTLDVLLEKLMPAQSNHIVGLDIYRPGSVDPKYKNLKASLRNDRLVTACFGKTAQDDKSKAAPGDAGEVAPNNIGFVTLPRDEEDKVLRRHILWQGINDPTYPCRAKSTGALSLRLALRYLREQGISREDLPKDEFIKIGGKVFNPLTLHTGGYHRVESNVEGGVQVMLNYRPYQNYLKDIAPTVSLTDVLNNQITDFQNRIVLMGVDLINEDRHATPYTTTNEAKDTVPGVFIHAQMVSHILDIVSGKRHLIWAWTWWIDILWVWMWAIVGGILAEMVNWQKGDEGRSLLTLVVFGGGAFTILYGACFGVLFLLEGWIPLLPSMMALLITGGSITVYKILRIQKNA